MQATRHLPFPGRFRGRLESDDGNRVLRVSVMLLAFVATLAILAYLVAGLVGLTGTIFHESGGTMDLGGAALSLLFTLLLVYPTNVLLLTALALIPLTPWFLLQRHRTASQPTRSRASLVVLRPRELIR